MERGHGHGGFGPGEGGFGRGEGGSGWHEGLGHAGDEWWSAPLHALMLLALVALLVVGIVWLVRRLGSAQTSTVQIAPAGAGTAALAVPRGGVPGGADPAIAELRLRYARGDVTRDDFQRTLDDLEGARTAWPGEETAPTES
jgi:uncharacterized membrane protein